MLPRKRDEGLVVRKLEGDTLVYDRQRHQAHCLNRAAALVWHHCDGATSVADLASLLHKHLKIPAEDTMVWLALDRLARANLLAERIERREDRYSRRDVARKLGVALVAVPLVMTILAPTAAEAASTCAPGPPCNRGTCTGTQTCTNVGGGICRGV
jgi:hypothetical protein